MQIHKPTENRFCKGLFFAPAGAGKTVLLGTAQEDERTSPMLVLDFEGGTESLAGLDIDVAPIRGWDDFNDIYEALANKDVLEVDGREVDFGAYKSLGVDSISETHKFALLEILRKEGPSRRDPDLIEMGDYGRASTQMRRLLRKFRDLDLHVFFVAHAKEVEVPREGRVRLPDLAGQMAEEISGLVSVQGYLAQFEENGDPHRTLLLHSFPRFRIKARTPWKVSAPEEIIDPTITDLLDALGWGDGYEARGSSRGKQITDEVPEDEEGRLPGKDPGKDTSDATSGDLSGEDGETQENVGTPDLESLTLREMKSYAEENEIDLNGARTRAAARAAIEAAVAA